MKFKWKQPSLKPLKRWSDKDNLIKLFIVAWPTILGLFWNEIGKNVVDNTKQIFSWDKPLDLISIGFWALTILWLILFFFSVVIEDASVNKKFDRIRATILKAPDMSAFSDAKSIFDFVFNITEVRLRAMRTSIINEIETAKTLKQSGTIINSSDHLKMKNDLKTALITINNSILELTTRFFRNSSIDGVNMMLFFSNEPANKDIIDKLCAISTQLYMRCDHMKDLEGILFLEKGFYSKKGVVVNNTSMIIPIYSKYIEVYKNPNEEQVECIIPGAMLAFKLGSSMVGDTRDLKKYYQTLDARTQKEIKDFWHNDIVGREIRSFTSFKTPGAVTNPTESVGILNFDSKQPFAFGDDEEFFATFYTLIHPMLQLSSEYLRLYRDYIILSY